MQQRSVSCQPYRRQVPAWIDGELMGAERHQVAAHVTMCEACQAEAAAWRSLGAVLHGAGPVATSVPEGLRAGVLAVTAPSTPRPASFAWLFGLAFVIAVTTGLTWLFWRGHVALAVAFICLVFATAGLLTLVALLGLWPDATPGPGPTPPLTPTEEV